MFYVIAAVAGICCAHDAANADNPFKKLKKYVKKEVVGTVTGSHKLKLKPYVSVNSGGRQVFHTNGQRMVFNPGPFKVQTSNLPYRAAQTAAVMSGDPNAARQVAAEQAYKLMERQRRMQMEQAQRQYQQQMQRMQQFQSRGPTVMYRVVPHPQYGYPVRVPVYVR